MKLTTKPTDMYPLLDNRVVMTPSGEVLDEGGKDYFTVIGKKKHLRIRAILFDPHFPCEEDEVGLLGIPEAEEKFLHAEKGMVRVHHLSSEKTIVIFLAGATRIEVEATMVVENGWDMLCYAGEKLAGKFSGVGTWGLKEAIFSEGNL